MSRKRRPGKGASGPARKPSRPRRPKDRTRRSTVGHWLDSLAPLGAGALLMVPPLVFSPQAYDAFRLPKMLLGEGLAVVALLLLLPRLRHVDKIDWRALARHPALWAALPLAAVSAFGLLASSYPHHLYRALPPWLLGLACAVGWSLGLQPREQRWLWRATIVPGMVLALLGILQFHGWYQPLEFSQQIGERLQVTSLAGGAFDLAAFLLLPCLAAQAAAWSASGWRRWAWWLALAICLYGIAASQTLSVLLVLGVATGVLWWQLLPRRRVVQGLAALAGLGLLLTLAVTPLRQRVVRKAAELSSGEINRVLSGRFDGWRAAWWMFTEQPLSGVGHGAFRAEYGSARLQLSARGVQFSRFQHQVFFTHAHNEYLQALAEWGGLGLLAMLWAGGMICRSLAAKLRHLPRSGPQGRLQAAELLSMVVAVALLAAVNFPLHLAICGFPIALLFAAVLRPTGAVGEPA